MARNRAAAFDGPLLPARDPCRFDLLAFGQNSLDRVGRFQALPGPGGSAQLASYRELPGGQVATAVLAATRLGLRCAYLGSVGGDAAADAVLAPLAAAGVDLSGVVRVSGARTRLAIVLVDAASGERRVLWDRDPRLELGAAGLPDVDLGGVASVLVDAEDVAASAELARRARRAGVPVLLDAERYTPDLELLVGLVDFPIVTEAFAASFSGTGSALDGLARLDAEGARLAVMSMGPRGALASCGGRLLASPAYETDSHDTTGAGDAFRAGFAWALHQRMGVEPALRAASATAALSCQGAGAQGGLPDVSMLESFMADNQPGPWRGPRLVD